MPTLTIGDKSVSVGDDFLKLSKEQQDATVEDIAKSLGVSNAPAASAAAPVGINDVVRSTATGVPVIGGLLNKANAATNALFAPVVEPLLSPSASDISRKGESWAQRYRKSLEMQDAQDAKFAVEHPVVDTVGKLAGGVAGAIPLMAAAPAAFGLTGTLPQMVARGAASNAGLGVADAAVRGEDVVTAGAISGGTGAVLPLAARGVGNVVQSVRNARNPAPPVAQTVEDVAGVKVPLTQGQATADPVLQAEEEIFRRGGAGGSAEQVARQADDEARAAIGQASSNISAQLDPTGQMPRTVPQNAAEVVSSELQAQQAARNAAEVQQAIQVGEEGTRLARGLGGGTAPATPFDAAESVGAGVARARDAAVARTREAYRARDAVQGTFDDSVPKGMAEDIRSRLNSGDDPLWVDPTNESTANKALKLIDETVGRGTGVFRNSVAPKPIAAPDVPVARAPAAPAKPVEDETVAALRAQYGDDVADSYARQNGLATPSAASQPLSLTEFVASKGGLAPNGELDAIGLTHGTRTQVPGQKGFFGVVRRDGDNIDRMREAAEEAGYFRGSPNGTSTPREFLDALDAEMRGQKLFPEGVAGGGRRRDVVASRAREQSEVDRITAGIEDDLNRAGYGDLGPEMKQRAVALMREEGMKADDAAEAAFRQLEQEDAIAAASRGRSDFPGDTPMESAANPRPVDLKAMDAARKRLVTMFGDAKSKALSTGDKSDMRAMGKILDEFDNVIGDALESGKFTGDAKLAKELQDAARKSHSEYRQTFSSRGPGDEIGRSVEKILGRYTDSAASPDEIAKMSYGSVSEPGGGKAARIAGRMKSILGEDSPEWGRYKQGLFSHLTQMAPGETARAPAQIADRIDRFLNGGTGQQLANSVYSAGERQSLANYARSLRGIEPRGPAVNDLERALARITGADGHLPASPTEVADMLFSRNGKGDKGISVRLAQHLKPRGNGQGLTEDGWTAVRQGAWERLVNAGEGKTEFGPQALSQRLHDFLFENGKPLANVLFTAAERAEMAKLAAVYKKMAPIRGTTNPSGTAPMLAKIADKASQNMLALVGLGTGGVTGAVAGHAVQSIGRTVKEARQAQRATQLFFGEQPKRPLPPTRVPVLAGATAAGFTTSQR